MSVDMQNYTDLKILKLTAGLSRATEIIQEMLMFYEAHDKVPNEAGCYKCSAREKAMRFLADQGERG